VRRGTRLTTQGSLCLHCTQETAQGACGGSQHLIACATEPHLEHRYSRVLVQCLLYYAQGDTRLLLYTLNPLRHILSGQERVYALVYPRALLRKRPRGIGDEGLFKSRRCVVHCKSCARLGMSCVSLRLRRAKWRRCGHGSRHGIDAGVRSDRRRVEVHL